MPTDSAAGIRRIRTGSRAALARRSTSAAYASTYLNSAFSPWLSPAADGMTDGFAVFHGSHVYDPRAGIWATRDALAGAMNDPISQHLYAWNRNNYLAFHDYTGDAATEEVTTVSDPSLVLCAGTSSCPQASSGPQTIGIVYANPAPQPDPVVAAAFSGDYALASGMIGALGMIIPGGPEARGAEVAGEGILNGSSLIQASIILGSRVTLRNVWGSISTPVNCLQLTSAQ